MLLEEGGGMHFIVNVRGILWPLQSRNPMQYQHKNSCTTAYSCSKKRHHTQQLEHRPPSDARKDCRHMPSKKIEVNPIIQSRFQFVQPVGFWKTSNELL